MQIQRRRTIPRPGKLRLSLVALWAALNFFLAHATCYHENVEKGPDFMTMRAWKSAGVERTASEHNH